MSELTREERDPLHLTIELVRKIIKHNCTADPHGAMEIRHNPKKYSCSCFALAEMEYDLVRLHDGNFHEVEEKYQYGVKCPEKK